MSGRHLRTLGRDFDWRRDRLAWPVTTDVGPALAGVVATETRVVWLDPASGRLCYRGVAIETLAASYDFERVCFLLLAGERADDAPEAFGRFRAHLRASRALPEDVVGLVRDLDPGLHPTRLLRAGVSALGCHELSVEDDLAGERHWRELRIVGQVASLVGEILRHRRGAPPLPPAPDASLAEAMLTALSDDEPSEADVRTLDLLWVLLAAHGLDAPTFTSMVVASCRADPYYNVVAGLSALRGPRQGGASERVLAQLLPLQSEQEAASWVRRTLADGGVIAGFGHPAYRTPDPRVALLRDTAEALARRRGGATRFAVARAVEDAASEALAPRGVHVNVNFYGALLFHLLGAEAPIGPCLFAVARMAGMAALVKESLDDIRLYRPRGRYVGVGERAVPQGRRT